MLVPADKKVVTNRYGVVELGDGLEYMVSRAGVGTRGERLRSLIEEHDKAEDGKTREKLRVDFVLAALGAFYSNERIHALLEADCISLRDMAAIASAVMDVDEPAKKNFSGASTASSNGE